MTTEARPSCAKGFTTRRVGAILSRPAPSHRVGAIPSRRCRGGSRLQPLPKKQGKANAAANLQSDTLGKAAADAATNAKAAAKAEAKAAALAAAKAGEPKPKKIAQAQPKRDPDLPSNKLFVTPTKQR